MQFLSIFIFIFQFLSFSLDALPSSSSLKEQSIDEQIEDNSAGKDSLFDMSNFMEMIEKLQSQLESNIKKEGKEGNEKLPLSSDLLNNQKKNINDGQKDSIVDDSNSFKRKEKERRGGDSDIKPGSSKQSFFSSFSSMTGIGAIIEQAIKKNSIMIFAKSYCPFCNKAEKVFRDDLKVSYYRMDLDKIGKKIFSF